MTWWLILVIALFSTFLLLIPASLFADKNLRHELGDPQKAVEMVELDVPPGPWTRYSTLIVYLPGILADADMISPRVLKAWAKRGEVWGANYIPPRFRPDLIVEEIADWVLSRCQMDGSVHNVVFIGSSMGGLLADDVLKSMQLHAHKYKVVRHGVVSPHLMLVDAPTGRKDLQGLLSFFVLAVKILPFGPLWNHVSWLLMRFFLVPGPKEKETDKDVNPDWLADQVAAARSFPLSFWRDQIMYIIGHGAPEPGSINCPIIYIGSTDDREVVRPDASRAWFRAGRPGFFGRLYAKGAKHAAYSQNPSAYEKVFADAFDYLRL